MGNTIFGNGAERSGTKVRGIEAEVPIVRDNDVAGWMRVDAAACKEDLSVGQKEARGGASQSRDRDRSRERYSSRRSNDDEPSYRDYDREGARHRSRSPDSRHDSYRGRYDDY